MFDAVIIGLGGMGSAAAYHLSRRDKKVLGLERFSVAHGLGSSHGRSRIIRQAYFEGAEYVPLVMRAYELWEELERGSGEDLMEITGALMIGSPDSEIVSGSLKSAEEHDLHHEMLDAKEIKRRYPAFDPPPVAVALFEKRAGFVKPEASVKAHLDLAAENGAELHFEEPVTSWEASENGVEVKTKSGSYRAERLIIAAGAWASEMLVGMSLPLRVERRVMHWFEPRGDTRLFSRERFPIFLWDPEGEDVFYGVPDAPGAVKAAFHYVGEDCDPDTLEREVGEEEVSKIRSYLERYVPDLAGRRVESKACMYTNTPDSHFVISQHPAHPQVSVAAGFSGHGYKFCGVVGEILADLTTIGETRHPIGLFDLVRFGEER
ncbi:MAG: N-methyl-L-tryptophan oxidase [Rubrobacteraceae bacterium]